MRPMAVFAAAAFALPALLPSASTMAAAEPPPSKPNVIFVLADDLGIGDIGPYGQRRIRTPHLDRMAAEGLLFTQAYSGSPLCGPSRSCLLTGLHAGHTQIRHNPAQAAGWDRTAQGDPPLHADTPTFARLFKQAGYSTAIIGKWGLGRADADGSPSLLGFDHFFGYDSHVSAHSYYPPFLWRNGSRVPLDGKTYSHDLMTAEAFEFVRRHKGEPFILYLAYTLPHGRFEPPSVAPYADEKWPEAEKKHAAMVTRLDRDLGGLFALLKDLGIDDDTLVLFASDNGPCTAGGHKTAFFDSNAVFRSEKGGPYEGAIRIPFIARWPGRVPAGDRTDMTFAFWDFLPTCADLLGTPSPQTDGLSILPTLLGKPEGQQKRDYLYWELAVGTGMQGIRVGNYKAELLNVSLPTGPRVELYDLSTDPGQKNDVANQHPDIVAQVKQIAATAHMPSRMFALLPDEMKQAGRDAAPRRNNNRNRPKAAPPAADE